MKAVVKTVRVRRDVSARHAAVAARTALGISGALISIAGIVLTAGGLLSPFEGSVFYALTGLGLIISGTLVARRHRSGAWTYLAVFVLTVTWSLRNVDDGSSLGQRLLGPAILLAMLAVLMPQLSRWHPRRAAIAFASIMVATIGLGAASMSGGPLSHPTAALTHFLDSEAKGVLQ